MSVVKYVEKSLNVLVWQFTKEAYEEGVPQEFNNSNVVFAKDSDGEMYCWVHTYNGTQLCDFGEYIAYHERKGYMVLDAEDTAEILERVDTPLDRLYIERRDLQDKFKKLQEFIISSKYDELSYTHKQLIQFQAQAMDKYIDILSNRISLME